MKPIGNNKWGQKPIPKLPVSQPSQGTNIDDITNRKKQMENCTMEELPYCTSQISTHAQLVEAKSGQLVGTSVLPNAAYGHTNDARD